MVKTKDPLSELRRIERELKELERRQREENRIMAAELVDRQRRGLTGEDAVMHWNDWMLLHDLPHLVID